MNKCSPLAAGLVVLFMSLGAFAADACKNRGELDQMYCDDNSDMVADAPTDAKKWKNPSTIVFTYTPVEDPAVYENIFKPFTTALGKCLDKKVVFYQVQSNAAEIEAMRSGRLHVAGFSTGPTAFAVNLAGAVSRSGPDARQGLQDHLLRQARSNGDGCEFRRLRWRSRRVGRLPSHGR